MRQCGEVREDYLLHVGGLSLGVALLVLHSGFHASVSQLVLALYSDW